MSETCIDISDCTSDVEVSLMNAINVIAPYKLHGVWVFDDPRVGLVQEPFVAGADKIGRASCRERV